MPISDQEKYAIFEAIEAGNVEYIRSLKYSAQEINALRDDENLSPLFIAIYHAAPDDENFEIVKILSDILNIEANIAGESGENHSYTALTAACRHGKIHIARYFLDEGANMYSPTEEGFTPFSKALQSKSLEMCKLLIKRGFNVLDNHTYYKGKKVAGDRTYLHDAVEFEFPKGVEMLLELGISALSTLAANDSNALHMAVISGNTDICEMLINHVKKMGVSERAFVKIKNSRGMTALHYASHSGSVECAKILIKNGADINAVSKYGTVLEDARNVQREENRDLTDLITYFEQVEKDLADGK